MPFGDRTPVVDGSPTQWVGSDPDSFGPDNVDIDDIGQVGDVGVHIVMALSGG